MLCAEIMHMDLMYEYGGFFLGGSLASSLYQPAYSGSDRGRGPDQVSGFLFGQMARSASESLRLGQMDLGLRDGSNACGQTGPWGVDHCVTGQSVDGQAGQGT